MSAFAMVNGALLPEQSATIPVSDPGFLFGDGCFTTIRVSDGVPQWVEEHFERLFRDSRELELPVPDLQVSMLEAVIEANGAEKGLWRLKVIVTKGGNTVITMAPYRLPERAARIKLLENPPSSPYYRVKRLAYLDRLWMQRAAQSQCFDAYVGVDREGRLLESAFANLVWLKNGLWHTPDYNRLPIMKGIALCKLLEAPLLGFYTLEDIGAGAKIYLCNSLHHLWPVALIGECDTLL